MSKASHITPANTVELLKITQSQAHPSEAAVIAGKREPYHLTYIKKYGYANTNRTMGQAVDESEDSIYESDSKVPRK